MSGASGKTVIVIGAGPTGLAAAHGAIARGHTPIVLEKDIPGSALRRWGATRFFTPLAMNLPKALLDLAHVAEDARDAIMTGPAFAELLADVARSPVLAPHVKVGHRVELVARASLSRGDHAGHPVRAELPFRVVCRTPEGPRAFEADAVLDASGTYDLPTPLHASGAADVGARVLRDLGAVHERREELAGRRILLVGHGHSAANAIALLAAIAEESPETRVTWAFRSRNLRPLPITPSDPLPERARVVTQANALAQKPPPWLTIERAAVAHAIAQNGASLRVMLSGNRPIDVDRMIALTGTRPDHSFLSELPLEISPATEGAMRLDRALANVTDCLTVPKVAAHDLASGEPRFHLVGAKSYGRARTFLLQTGFAQLDAILDGLFTS